MKTRASIKLEAQENLNETQPVGAQSQTANEPPQKRARRKGPSQPVRGGWDELPHNLGRVDLTPKEKAIPSGKGIISSAVPGPALPLTPGSPQGNAIGADKTDVGASIAEIPTESPCLEMEANPGLPAAPLDVQDEGGGKTLVPKRIRRKTKDNPYGLMFGRTPYPDWQAPSIEACVEVHRLLTEVHGKVIAPAAIPPPSLTVAGCGEVPSVLDALMRTILSAATTMVAANEAFASLVDKYGTVRTGIGKGSVNWKKVRQSSTEELAETIKRGGLANTKAADIMKILDIVWAEQRILSLDHLHGKTAQEAMLELVRYPRIGVKTAACVILFCLRVPCFAVDTHVHRFSKWLKWVPPTASAEMTFWHCENRVPDDLKYGLHQLFIRHGQTCGRCRADTTEGTEAWNNSTCVLEELLERNKARKKTKTVPKVKKEENDEKEKEGGLEKKEALPDSQDDTTRYATGMEVKEEKEQEGGLEEEASPGSQDDTTRDARDGGEG